MPKHAAHKPKENDLQNQAHTNAFVDDTMQFDEGYDEDSQALEYGQNRSDEIDNNLGGNNNGLVVFEGEPVAKPRASHARHEKGKKKSKKKDLLPYQRKSRRVRRILIAIIVLLALLFSALIYFTFQWFEESKVVATQQTQNQETVQDALGQGEVKDTTPEAVKKTSVPNLVALLGLTQEEAIAALKRGATVVGTKTVNEEDNPIKQNVTVALTDEPADARTGTPTVYLSMNEEGAIIQVGYSASTATLGFMSYSFTEAVEKDHVVENTLKEAGLHVEEGTVVLPTDKTEYSTYATDGTTLVRDNCAFEGASSVGDTEYTWSAVLSYDYTKANMSGNIADDTIRIIYVYISA